MQGSSETRSPSDFLTNCRLSVCLHCRQVVPIHWTAIAQTFVRCRRRAAGMSGDESRTADTEQADALDLSDRDARESADRVFHEILASLSLEERFICFWIAFGFSKQHIANVSGRSIDTVERILERVRQIVHDRLNSPDSESKQ